MGLKYLLDFNYTDPASFFWRHEASDIARLSHMKRLCNNRWAHVFVCVQSCVLCHEHPLMASLTTYSAVLTLSRRCRDHEVDRGCHFQHVMSCWPLVSDSLPANVTIYHRSRTLGVVTRFANFLGFASGVFALALVLVVCVCCKVFLYLCHSCFA